MKFTTKPMQYFPPHLRHVATLPWKIKTSDFSRYSADMDEDVDRYRSKESKAAGLLEHTAGLLACRDLITAWYMSA